METRDAIKQRRSIREYSERPIAQETMMQILDAGRFATTARNIQPWEFIVVKNPSTLKQISQLAVNGKFITSAQACIAVFCQDTPYYLEDGCAATQNILLAATDLGVGSCWIAGDRKPYCPQINALLGVPPTHKLISLIALGYPKDPGQFYVAEKHPLNTMIHWEKF
jgi:nitroreductase